MTEPDDGHPADALDAIVVDPDDIIEAFRRNRRDETEQREHVLRVSPPFEGERKAKLYVSRDHTYYPREMDPKPIHLSPEMFVGYESGEGPEHQTDIQIPTWGESRRIARDDHGDNADERTVEEYHEVAMEVWEERVHSNLNDAVRVARDPETGEEVWVEVEYK